MTTLLRTSRAVGYLALPILVGACTGGATTRPGEQATIYGVDGRPQRGTSSITPTPAPSGRERKRVGPAPDAETLFPSALPSGRANANRMVAHFIDVGQGDATLLEFSCGAVLIDTGGERTDEVSGRERLGDYLNDFFLRRSDLAFTLNLVVLSHPHVDHNDGVNALLDSQPQITILNVLDNGATKGGSLGISGQKKLQKYAADTAGVGYLGLSESAIEDVAGMTNNIIDPIDCSGDGGVDPKISAMWGRVDLDTAWANDANNDSVVLRVQFGNATFLFTGDLEEQGIAAMLDSYAADPSAFNMDVLKVGHHGSHNGTTEDFVAALSPKIAVIQAGDSALSQERHSAFSYGHPHEDTIDKLLDSEDSMTRPSSKTVRVGVKGANPLTGAPPEFKTVMMSRAILSNGWDGNIAVIAEKDGTLSFETGF